MDETLFESLTYNDKSFLLSFDGLHNVLTGGKKSQISTMTSKIKQMEMKACAQKHYHTHPTYLTVKTANCISVNSYKNAADMTVK